MRTSPRARGELAYRLLGRCEYSVSGLGDINVRRGRAGSDRDFLLIFSVGVYRYSDSDDEQPSGRKTQQQPKKKSLKSSKKS
jgi:hypothetical protein